jgi:hypothetical protein
MNHVCAEPTCQEELRPDDPVVVAAGTQPIGTEAIGVAATGSPGADAAAAGPRVVFHQAHWWQRPRMKEVARGLLSDVVEDLFD